MFWITFLNSITYTFDTFLYTLAVTISSYLPDAIDRWVVRQLFTTNTMGSMERGDCIYLTNRCTKVDEKLLFDKRPRYLMTSAREALDIARETGLPIQTIVSYYSKEYFLSDMVCPQPYELVYEYGEVGVKDEKDYERYFFDRLSARPSISLYDPSLDNTYLIIVSLLCSRVSMVLMYMLLRYQWYNRVCFRGFLVLASIGALLLQ